MGSLLTCIHADDIHCTCDILKYSERSSMSDGAGGAVGVVGVSGAAGAKRSVDDQTDGGRKRWRGDAPAGTPVATETVDVCSSPPPSLHIDALPQSILIHVFSKLTLYDLLQRASLVSHYWHQVALDSALWRRVDLSMQKCVTDVVLERITRLSDKVVSVNLSDSRLITNEGVVTMATNCTQLATLKLIRCMWLRDTAIAAITDNCTRLTELFLDTCFELSDTSLEKIASRCPKLQLLQVNQCPQMTDVGVKAIAKGCPALRTLSLEHCKKVKGSCLPDLVAGCPNLQLINCINCDFSTEALQHFTKFRELRVLELSQISSVKDLSVKAIVKHCSALETLNLSLCTNVTDDAIDYIARHAHNIRNLYLVSCTLTDKALLSLGAHSRTVRNVDVGWCEAITDAGVVLFSQTCPSLHYLGLMRCDLVTIPTMEVLVAQHPHIKYSTMWLDCMRLIERARHLLPDFPAR